MVLQIMRFGSGDLKVSVYILIPSKCIMSLSQPYFLTYYCCWLVPEADYRMININCLNLFHYQTKINLLKLNCQMI